MCFYSASQIAERFFGMFWTPIQAHCADSPRQIFPLVRGLPHAHGATNESTRRVRESFPGDEDQRHLFREHAAGPTPLPHTHLVCSLVTRCTPQEADPNRGRCEPGELSAHLFGPPGLPHEVTAFLHWWDERGGVWRSLRLTAAQGAHARHRQVGGPLRLGLTGVLGAAAKRFVDRRPESLRAT